MCYRLKKLSITPEQAIQVINLASKGLTGRNIAIKLNIPQPKIWRNMQLLGLLDKNKNDKK